jgi:PAS domain S-box-containing protein
MMSTEAARRRSTRFVLGVLGAAMAGVVTTHLVDGASLVDADGLHDAVLAAACVLSAGVILWRVRSAGLLRSLPFLAFGILAMAVVAILFMLNDFRSGIEYSPSPYDSLFLLIGAIFFIPIGIEYRQHFRKELRGQIAADVALGAASIAVILYLALRPALATSTESLSAAVFAMMVATALTAYGALVLWVPSLAHAGQFGTIAAFSAGAVVFAEQWVRGTYTSGRSAVDLPLALGALGLAFVVTAAPRRMGDGKVAQPSRFGRAVLTTVAVATACAALGLVAAMETNSVIGPVQASGLIYVLGVAVAVRILVTQLRSTQATRDAQDALEAKEAALRETDKALARLQRANETLRESEERLRLVFEAAVDGIVELDHKDVIVRANEAFCSMLDLPQSMVEGQPWVALAAAIEADESFTGLPTTGQGKLLLQEGNATYLEARTSEIPGAPPRRLLLVRDVSAQRVADQTIRSLFKFLQDRDEDRTRIMRRTNAAIESERNRIARDLHDGPVQGVSAASLSLEAVLLMLKAGEDGVGMEVLTKVRQELAEEADNLRRLMAGLRPPLLEERGLVPALRETVEKFGRENKLDAEFAAQGVSEVPQDLETLAYRVVQEALSNAGKHAEAVRIGVAVEAVAGQLRIEVIDDGVGFDAAKAREFLRMGRVGLASMRERVELANGTFMVHSTPGRGTTVVATLPLESVPGPRAFAVNEAS